MFSSFFLADSVSHRAVPSSSDACNDDDAFNSSTSRFEPTAERAPAQDDHPAVRKRECRTARVLRSRDASPCS